MRRCKLAPKHRRSPRKPHEPWGQAANPPVSNLFKRKDDYLHNSFQEFLEKSNEKAFLCLQSPFSFVILVLFYSLFFAGLHNWMMPGMPRVPPVLLGVVFGCLRPRDALAACRLVCKEWAAVRGCWSALVVNSGQETRCFLEASEPARVKTLACNWKVWPYVFEGFAHLTQLELEVMPQQNVLAVLVAELRELEALFVSQGTLFTDAVLEVMKLPRLRHFRAASVRSNVRGVSLFSLQSLQVLEISVRGLLQADAFAAFPVGLRKLQLRGALFTDDAIWSLARSCPLLQKLDLCSCTDVSDRGLESLASCRQLQELRLAFAEISACGLVHLAQLKSLRTLEIIPCNRLATHAAVPLIFVNSLAEVHLNRDWCVTDSTMNALCCCRALRHLFLCDPDVTESGMALLGKKSALTLLSLVNVQFATWRWLEDFTFLAALRLCGVELSDEHVESICVVPSLQTLELQDEIFITDLACGYLSAARFVDIRMFRCEQITLPGYRRLLHSPTLRKLELNLAGRQQFERATLVSERIDIIVRVEQ